MTKRQLIDEIIALNRSARPGFLAQFDDGQLRVYLQHLRVVQIPRVQRDPRRYERYFVGLEPAGAAGTAESDTAVVTAPAASDAPSTGPAEADASPPAEGVPSPDVDHREPAAVSGRFRRPEPVHSSAGDQDAESWLY